MRHRKRQNIIIELTPLLDVIMILIFIVMTQNGNKVAEAKAETLEAQKQVSEITMEFEQKLSEDELKLQEKDEAYAALEKEFSDQRIALAVANDILDKGDSLEYFKRIAEISGRYDSLAYLEQYVDVINISLTPVIGVDYVDTLFFSRKGNTTLAKPYIMDVQDTATIDLAIFDLSAFLTSSIEDYIAVTDGKGVDTYLVITFNCYYDAGAHKANTDKIEKLIKDTIDKYPEYNISSKTNKITEETQ